MSTVLIVDDDAAIRRMLIRRLQKKFHVIEADSLDEVFKYLDNGDVDVLLLDQSMPDRSGLDYFEAIRDNYADAPPAIMMTAHASINLAVTFLMAGGSDFVEKPLDIDVLSLKIQRALKIFSQVRREIANRQNAERELLKTNDELRVAMQAARKATTEKNMFIANLSHEMRTPLNSIFGFIDMLSNDDRTLPDHRNILGILRQSADGLLDLVNDCLDLSKIEAGRVELDDVPFDLEDTIMDAASMVMGRLRGRDVQLLVDMIDRPGKLQGDPKRLRQVLVNLLGNAIKFTEAGEIVIAVKVVSREADVAVVEICVTDSGRGISNADQTAIFDVFRQVQTPEKEDVEGTGLGLTICRKLVRLMGGDIHVVSKLGAGTTFTFTIAVNETSDPETIGVDRNLPAAIGRRILVLHRNETALRILQRMTSDLGFDVDIALERSEGLRLASDGAYDAVLIDMSTIDAEVGECIAATRRDGMTTVPLFVAVVATQTGLSGALNTLGFDRILYQPFTFNTMISTLMRANDASRETAAADGGTSTHESLPHLRILLAEDNRLNQTLITKMLESLGHVVSLAINGIEAVNKSTTSEFDVILMDLQMPSVGGLEATRQLRQQGVATPIIALTASVSDPVIAECREAGMDCFLSKPIRTIREIGDAVDSVCRNPASR